MLICCSRNIYYYQCWKQLSCMLNIFVIHSFFRILWLIESSKEQHLLDREIFWNITMCFFIIYFFKLTFDQFNPAKAVVWNSGWNSESISVKDKETWVCRALWRMWNWTEHTHNVWLKTTAVQHLHLALSQLAIKNIIMSFIKFSFS